MKRVSWLLMRFLIVMTLKLRTRSWRNINKQILRNSSTVWSELTNLFTKNSYKQHPLYLSMQILKKKSIVLLQRFKITRKRTDCFNKASILRIIQAWNFILSSTKHIWRFWTLSLRRRFRKLKWNQLMRCFRLSKERQSSSLTMRV
jgi:hypothetical protein